MPDQVITEEAASRAANVATVTLVASTSTALLAANASRECLIVSANVADVWLFYGAGPAVVGHGHCVRTGGAPWVDKTWKGAVFVISTGLAVVGSTECLLSVGEDQGEEPTGSGAFVPQAPAGETTPTASLPIVGE
jgi:hypothetical protein